MKFFWKDATGVNSDIERHRAMEKELMLEIAALEASKNEMSIAHLRVYRNMLRVLQQSKADVVAKIGR